jgi:hypothetical protein
MDTARPSESSTTTSSARFSTQNAVHQAKQYYVVANVDENGRSAEAKD